MNGLLTWQIAVRYLRGKRSANAVPILSRISMVAIAVGSAAMIILVSVFNGFDFLVKDMYKAFYPDIKISAVKGKFFSEKAISLTEIRHMKGVVLATPVIEDNVLAGDENELAQSEGKQKFVALKGIENDYFKVNSVGDSIEGDDTVSARQPYTAIVGWHIAQVMGADKDNVFNKITLYYQNPSVTNPELDPENAFESVKLHPAGFFRVSDEFDDKYVLAPLSLAQTLFHREGQFSSIEIKAAPGAADHVIALLKEKAGTGFKVENRYEQNKTLYMVLSFEKWGGFVILLFVLIIASFNMVGGLSMLVVEKKKDIAILQAMGALPSEIRRIFIYEGILWSCVGGFFGLALGYALCIAQMQFGLIGISPTSAITAFPVRLLFSDFLLITGTIITLGLLASLYPAIRATHTRDMSLKST